ncbi:transposable element Tcb1 transposase [Trichonephila clavipes]|nr:transposable element Tcb1 transposase [Trichonephila clavipes]
MGVEVYSSDQLLINYPSFDRGPNESDLRSGLTRDSGLPFRKIGSRVRRDQTTVMRICDRWMQDGTKDRSGRPHPPQSTTSRLERQIVRMAMTDSLVTSQPIAQHIESITYHSVSTRTI